MPLESVLLAWGERAVLLVNGLLAERKEVDYDELDEKEKRRVGIEIKKRKNARLQPISSDK